MHYIACIYIKCIKCVLSLAQILFLFDIKTGDPLGARSEKRGFFVHK